MFTRFSILSLVILFAGSLLGCGDKGYVHDENVDRALKEVRQRNLRAQQQRKSDSQASTNSSNINSEKTEGYQSPYKKRTDSSNVDTIDDIKPSRTDQPEKIRTSKSEKWNSLRPGLTESEIREILGPPTMISSANTLMYWYYGTGEKAGKVAILNSVTKKVLWAWDPPQQ